MTFSIRFLPLFILFPLASFAQVTMSSSSAGISPFTSDGCSGSPDAIMGVSIVHCCIAHDFEYWLGGTEKDKVDADQALASCITTALGGDYSIVGDIYKMGVEMGGEPVYFESLNSPFDWRWAYGWQSDYGYTTLTHAELQDGLQQLNGFLSHYSTQAPVVFADLDVSPRQLAWIKKALKAKTEKIAAALKAE